MSRVTVVVATRNRRGELLRTLGMLTRLPERPPVIVVDNGSADGSAEAAAQSFPGVEIVALARNAGTAARNACHQEGCGHKNAASTGAVP